MKKRVIGYIFNDKKKSLEEKKFLRIAKKLDLELIFFNLSDRITKNELEEKAKKCDIIFNNCGDYIANELVKTFEILGKKVIDGSDAFVYPEDKWIFYMECRKNKIPCPETILLSDNIYRAKKDLEEFGKWPVVLKLIQGCRGEGVKRAKNMSEAIKIIKKFWERENDKIPIIAQEYINSDSYRVTLINGKIVQTAIKKRSGWKASGCQSESFKKFKVDKELEKISKKIVKLTKIKICGIDFAKSKDKWLVIEVNAEPSLRLFDCEYDHLIEETLKLLKSLANKK
jgi:RimK family alpha-L-glutamate ligase